MCLVDAKITSATAINAQCAKIKHAQMLAESAMVTKATSERNVWTTSATAAGTSDACSPSVNLSASRSTLESPIFKRSARTTFACANGKKLLVITKHTPTPDLPYVDIGSPEKLQVLRGHHAFHLETEIHPPVAKSISP
ncbi:uncharacterized protein LOC144097720 [Amblyomma americanum]